MQVQTDLQLQGVATNNSLNSPGTYKGGSSEMLSPTITAQQPITPAHGPSLVHFEFPPDLATPHGYQQSPIPSTRPLIHPQPLPMEAKENQAPMMMAAVYPQSSYPATTQMSQNNQLIVSSRLALAPKSIKTADIHTLGTGSTRSIQSVEDSSSTVSSLGLVPFSQLTSSINNFSISGPDVHPKRGKYRQMRKQARVVATAGGMVVGGLTLGPAGIVVGAGMGMATNKYYKRKDKKAQQKHEQNCFQQAANDSIVARHQGAFC